MPPLPAGEWLQAQAMGPRRFVCGFCGDRVGSDKGFAFRLQGSNQVIAFIFICPSCRGPSFFSHDGAQVPGTPLGGSVDSLPDEIRAVYEEARKSATVGAYTASVLVLRKLLMHIAVNCGATVGQPFVAYVQYL